jgi:galactokinase/mevalonate kinase-like predicted kinase
VSKPASTKEPQYNALLEVKAKHGVAQLGLMTNQGWLDDPKRLAFTLARYKFVAASLKALEGGDLREFGRRMHEHWEHEKRRSGSMSNTSVDDWYALARQNGAIGGKLVGAGGGGFLMFYTEDRMRLRHVMTEAGLKEIRFRFDFEGSKVLVG